MRRSRRKVRLHSVFSRSLFELRSTLAGWTLGVVSFCLVMLAIYPSVRGNAEFAKLINAYPATLRKLFNVTDYTTAPGYLRAEVFSFIAPLLLTIFALLTGSDLVAGEEERRTVDLLLASPLTRRRVVVEKWCTLVVGVATLTITLFILLGLVGQLFSLHVAQVDLSAEVLGCGLFALFVGTVALGWGAATGSRGSARGISAAILVVMYLITTLAQIVSWLRPAQPFSLWYQAIGNDPLTTGFHFWRLCLVTGATVAVLGLALFLYERRDLAT